jgi:hypothetical protein
VFAEDAFAVHHVTFGRIGAPAEDQARAGDIRRAAPDEGDADILHLLADDLQRVDESRQCDGGCALLVVVPDGDFRLFAQGVEDVEAFGLGDVLQVDAAKPGLEHQHRVDDGIRVLGVEHDRHPVHAAQVFVEQGLALHDRQARFGTNVAQPQHARPVADHGNGVPLVGVFVDQFRVSLDGFAGRGHAGRVPDGKIVETVDRAFERGFDLPPIEWMQFHGICRRLLGLGKQLFSIHTCPSFLSPKLFCIRTCPLFDDSSRRTSHHGVQVESALAGAARGFQTASDHRVRQ